MSRLTRYAIILALSFSCAVFYPVTDSTANAQDKTIKKPTGSVSGHITVKGKSKAGIVVGVRVGDFGPQSGPLSKATTDEDGNYRITDLPAGNYQIAPVAPAYIVKELSTFGQRGKALLLSEGEQVEGIDFSLVRGGVITGKVSFPDGRPVVEERITVTAADQTEPRRLGPAVSSSFQTDDRGIYRMFGIVPGRYKISVGQGQDPYFSGRPGRPTYQQVFYPDVTNSAEAKIIELEEGTEATNIDITIGESITGFAAAGVAIDGETNQPIANMRFGLQKVIDEHNSSFIGSTVISSRLGEFKFESVTPGKYAVFMMPQQNSEMRADPVSFEVVDQDVNGLTLRTSRGASISGSIVLEGNADKAIQSKLLQMRVQAYVRSQPPSGGGFVQTASINPDGSFRVGGLQAGMAAFQLATQDRQPVAGFVISRVERDGVHLPRGVGGVEIKSGEQITGLRIVVVYGSGIVRGTIKIENGPLPTDARLFLQLTKPGDPSFMVRPQVVDARGRFAIEGVPAGTYELYAQSAFPGSRVRPPSARQSVTVTEGAVTEVEMVIDLAANQSPSP